MTILRVNMPSLMKTKKCKSINTSALSTAFGGGKINQVKTKSSKRYNVRKAKNSYAI